MRENVGEVRDVRALLPRDRDFLAGTDLRIVPEAL
jgi:hypothetical protein